MNNKLYNANELYVMIREYYMNRFPHSANYDITPQKENIFSDILTQYLYKRGYPANVKINNGNFIIARSYSLERAVGELIGMPADKQETIINFIEKTLADDFENLMSDIIAMHRWLVQDGYISKSTSGNKEQLHMTTKFIDKKVFTI